MDKNPLISFLRKRAKLFAKNEQGITAIEYALIGLAVAAGLIVMLGSASKQDSFLGKLQQAFNQIGNKINEATNTSQNSNT